MSSFAYAKEAPGWRISKEGSRGLCLSELPPKPGGGFLQPAGSQLLPASLPRTRLTASQGALRKLQSAAGARGRRLLCIIFHPRPRCAECACVKAPQQPLLPRRPPHPGSPPGSPRYRELALFLEWFAHCCRKTGPQLQLNPASREQGGRWGHKGLSCSAHKAGLRLHGVGVGVPRAGAPTRPQCLRRQIVF